MPSPHISSTNSPGRASIQELDQQFVGLLAGLKRLVLAVPPPSLYKKSPSANSGSVGEAVIKSAAVLEQAFGGLTTNLWDDPFEWTLPETLSTPERLLEYLNEVDLARARALDSLADDSALKKNIAVPSGELVSIRSLLDDALKSAGRFAQRAADIHKILFSR